ncbi:LAG1-DNAbind-domain-containing protein [Auricularia subglabra TFB-10046 SS5]|nr:LAG1-DNAbind-domain-containing protein [Auricularia subglabra TFB-10046 SS5]
MSLDFSNYQELDPALHHDHQQQQQQQLAFDGPHDRFPMQDQLSYASFATAGPSGHAAYAQVPRYGQPGAALDHQQQQQHAVAHAHHHPHPHSHQQQGQPQPQYSYANEYMYQPPQSLYGEPLGVGGQQPALPHDILGGLGQQGQFHAHAHASGPPGHADTPFHAQPSAYPYGGPQPGSVAANALAPQGAYPEVLMPPPDRQRPAYATDNYGLALASALGPNIAPSLDQYQDRGVAYPAPDTAYHSQPAQPVAPAPGVGDTATDVCFDPMHFSPAPSQPAQPQQQQQDPIGLASPAANISVGDELAKLNLQPAHGPPGADFASFMRPFLEQYVKAPNRIEYGERTIIVMSSKVAQKSYGTEKRFLCPPPTAVLIGNSWWSEISRHGSDQGKTLPPRVVVSISGEPTPPECTVDWISASGKSFDPADPPPKDATTYIGRAVGKQLFISEVDEKKKKVEALIHVTAPTVDDGPERVIGIFKSRPIKVISKPSKKRQSAKNLELCINHGSTIALFHRLRAQTVSTKYLCVSGSGTAFKGSDGNSLHDTTPHRGASPSFAAQTTCWDSFIMYIVDVNRPNASTEGLPPPPPVPEFPSPPPNAIPFSMNGSQIPVYYNQTVVLQCLTSGVVSPVLIIRKVDHSTVVVGGGAQDSGKSVPDLYCAPGEVCGDPVSQLHKIAFEVFDSNKGAPELGHPGASGSFLACMGEKVNTHHPEEPRSWNNPIHSSPASHSPSLPGSPVISTPTSATSASSEYFNGTSGMSPSDHDFPSSDGGRVRRKRNSSSREGRAPTASAKGRRARQSSTGSNRGGSGNEAPTAGAATSGALWGIDVGETSIWTIVGTDQVRYNFYVPPTLFESHGTAPQPFVHPVPTKQVTPFPDVLKYLPPDRATEVPKCSSSRNAAVSQHAARMLTVYGSNFSKSDPVAIFFGAEPSPHVEVRCTEVLACLPPEQDKTLPRRSPILLVRSDGVVFPSNCLYP